MMKSHKELCDCFECMRKGSKFSKAYYIQLKQKQTGQLTGLDGFLEDSQ